MNARASIFLKITAVFVFAAAAWAINRSGLFQHTLDWIETLGVWAPCVFVTVYALSCIFFVPAFIFTVASGILFGLVKGACLSLAGGAIGAALAFLIGRYIAREPVRRLFAKNREFHALEGAVSARGWKIIVLARLSPIFPFLIGNYAFGLTRLSVWEYALASAAGTIPSAFAFAYAGTLLGSLTFLEAPGRERTPAEWALLAGGFISTVVLSLYLRRVAESALKDGVPLDEPGQNRGEI